MDLATFVGIAAGILAIVIGVISGGSPQAFIDYKAILIVLGGSFASTLISYRMHEITKILKVAANAFFGKPSSPLNIIDMLVELSQKARKEGLLALETDLDQLEDDYVKHYLQLIVDGIDPEIIRKSMELELDNLQIRHERGQGLFKMMGSLFPAWGMIGTLIGLITLLTSLNQPETIGPSMAIALVTTFYGALIANFLCNPIANKLEMKSREEIQEKEMIIEGILSVQAGENPRILEHKLRTFLSPDQKKKLEGEEEVTDEIETDNSFAG